MSALQYFTHAIDGRLYGAWYRVTSTDLLEVLGVGLLETCRFSGFSPENSAKSVLENFVRLRIQMGAPIPALTELSETTSAKQSPAPGQTLGDIVPLAT